MSDLAELFSRDPLTLTNEDIDEIIKHLREFREKQILADAVAAQSGKKRSGVSLKTKADKEKLDPMFSLDDLLGATN